MVTEIFGNMFNFVKSTVVVVVGFCTTYAVIGSYVVNDELDIVM